MVMSVLKILKSNFSCEFSTVNQSSSKQLFKYLMRQCEKLPEGPKEHYKFQIKQSFKQHIHETDPERIQQIIKKSYEDAEWVMKKYIPDKN